MSDKQITYQYTAIEAAVHLGLTVMSPELINPQISEKNDAYWRDMLNLDILGTLPRTVDTHIKVESRKCQHV